MKTCLLSCLFMSAACAYNPGAAHDADVQLALHGIAKTFNAQGLYRGDFVKDLDGHDWSVAFHDGAHLDCPHSADACTNIKGDIDGDQHIDIQLQEGGGWPECPRVMKAFMHELFHLALKWESGTYDADHLDPRWQREWVVQQAIDVCAVSP